MKRYALIMAGGNGERLFPLSTKKKPKQFLKLYGKDCMINETIKRIETVIPIENIFVILNNQQKELAVNYIDRRIKNSHILYEPKSLNTAVSIAYATMHITKKYGEGVMAIFSSDHYISKIKCFKNDILKAMKLASNEDSLITIGIKPSLPETQYGYIKYENSISELKNVKRFVEKPSFEKAKKYIEKGYLWNSGIFIWQSIAIKKALKKYLPKIYYEIKKIVNFDSFEEITNVYDRLYPISIDVGVMEKADNVKTIIATFEWLDLGNLRTLIELYEQKNINKNKINNIIELDALNIKTFSEKENKIFAIMRINRFIYCRYRVNMSCC